MYKKKLIETSIPLDDINEAASGEKNIRKGYPATLHLWFARRPLAAARCVIFASMIDDPSEHPELFPTESEQDHERERLHGIIRRLASWDNIVNKELYQDAHDEMVKYAPNGILPEFLDPFAGGGALPLEAQRLGLVSHAADLNPIPVTLNRAMIDIPARFNGKAPVHQGGMLTKTDGWVDATGLAEDVSFYSNLMRDEALKRIGKYYPKITVTKNGLSRDATPVAYIWARTVRCPNPACHCETPLMRSFWLGMKKGRRAYIDPVSNGNEFDYKVRFEADGWTDFSHVQNETVGRKGARCLKCGSPISLEFIRNEGQNKRIGVRLAGIACESPFDKGRWYVSPTGADANDANVPMPSITGSLSANITRLNPRNFQTHNYGMSRFCDLFTARQLNMLCTLSDLVSEMRVVVERDAIEAGFKDDGVGLEDGGTGAKAYAEAVSVYLAFIVGKLADSSSSICTWNSNPSAESVRNLFARQAIPMAWDFAEANPFSSSSGSIANIAMRIVDVVKLLPAKPQSDAVQRDATKTDGLSNLLVSTDPPYYDNIDYSDLSDYFYIWMRRSLRDVFPETFATMLTPKDEELIVLPLRHEGGGEAAKDFFEKGMRETFRRLAMAASDDYPMTVYYAYKQSEDSDDGRTSSGWETILQALMDANLQITGTWPMRTERKGRTVGLGSNALASSIVLVCRKRSAEAPIATRPEFQRELRKSLKKGLDDLRQGSIAPVDMAQASIGPGMAAFSKYSQVIESDGRPMSVHTALAMINEQLDALMGESGEELDAETRFCLTWYQQFGFTKGDFGTAETLRNARGADFGGLVKAGVLANEHGKTWLVRPVDVANPAQPRLYPSCWSDLMTMVAALESGGIDAAAEVAKQLDETRVEHAKSLAYLLFQAAENGKRTEDATWFNDFVTSWSDISERAEQLRRSVPVQLQFDFNV